MDKYTGVPTQAIADLSKEYEQTIMEQEKKIQSFTDGLQQQIAKEWTLAKEAKRPIEETMIRSLRQRNGIYENDKLAAIREMGGSEMYVLLTLTKCRAFEAWVSDILRPAGDKPWSLDPTPIPELPGYIDDEIKAEISLEMQRIQSEIVSFNAQELPEVQLAFREYMEDLREKLLEMQYQEAKEAAEKMEKVCLDQQIQGNFITAFKGIITDLATFKACILKGPVVRTRKVRKWSNGKGKWEQVLKDELVPEFDRVSPFDFYPAPGASCVDDGFLFERHFLNRGDLVSLIGVPGYKEDNVREALERYDKGLLKELLPIDTERYAIEHGETGTMHRNGKIESLEYWGSVPGRLLTEWGIDGSIDADKEYEINAWIIGDIVIKAVINPDKLGRKPYSVTSFEKVPGSIWGKGIPEMMVDIQDVCNAVARAIVNNSQLASGPMVEINVDKCDANTAMYPWKIFQSTNQTMSESPAVRFYQPNMYVGPLLQVYEFFSLAADETTGVPRWAYGNTNVGGAGQTSSGLSMLMTYAARGIKQNIQNLDDDIVSPTLERQYDYNMAYHQDETIKGDIRVVARGSSALIAREQQTLRLKEVLQLTGNPIDLQLLGGEARIEMLKQMFKAMDVEIESLPDKSKIEEIMDRLEAQFQLQGQNNPENQQAALMGQAPEAKEPQMDNSGQVMGGRDANLNLQEAM